MIEAPVPGYDSRSVDGRLLCRTTVNLSGAPLGSQVYVDPSQPLVRTYLRRGLLVPITDHASVTDDDPAEEPAASPQEAAGDAPTPETGEPSPGTADTLVGPENAATAGDGAAGE